MNNLKSILRLTGSIIGLVLLGGFFYLKETNSIPSGIENVLNTVGELFFGIFFIVVFEVIVWAVTWTYGNKLSRKIKK